MRYVEATCAFDRCQAGGVILAGAPRVTDPPFGEYTYGDWHPGCWAAEQRRAEAAR